MLDCSSSIRTAAGPASRWRFAIARPTRRTRSPISCCRCRDGTTRSTPRRPSLFEEFCTCFNDADTVVVAEVYPAGETPIAGIDRDHFVLGLRAHGHREVIPLPNSAALAGVVHGLAGRGDFVVCLGAGNITQWAYALPGELKALG